MLLAPVPVRLVGAGPIGPFKEQSRNYDWRETSVAEVYLWLALIIYMGIHKETRYEDHWSTSISKPIHPIIQIMPYSRFKQLLRRLRLCDAKNTKLVYYRCNEWSEYVQQASTQFYNPGDSIAVDECMIRYTGRSKQTVTIRSKPTPTGFKVWVVAQAGCFLRWLWSTPKAGVDVAAAATVAAAAAVTARSDAIATATAAARLRHREKPEKRKRDIEDLQALNPTQSIVVALVKMLPTHTYHVFMDVTEPIRVLRFAVALGSKSGLT